MYVEVAPTRSIKNAMAWQVVRQDLQREVFHVLVNENVYRLLNHFLQQNLQVLVGASVCQSSLTEKGVILPHNARQKQDLSLQG